jgi:tRNA pseudouridine38-40 synthase
MRYFFEIAYKGTNYSGWQAQPNAIGIQTEVEDALKKIFREDIQIVGSGRTDAGVHCEQQFFHCDIEQAFDPSRYALKLNGILPYDIAIRSIRAVKEDANARFDATSRSYQYRITRTKNPFFEELFFHYFKHVEIDKMQEAAQLLLGTHDFECFSKVKTDVNHFGCTITEARWHVGNGGEQLFFDISANRFLRGMVRAIVGTLLDVGTGRTSIDGFRAILASKDRKQAGANVAPHGLYLCKVEYPEHIFCNQ